MIKKISPLFFFICFGLACNDKEVSIVEIILPFEVVEKIQIDLDSVTTTKNIRTHLIESDSGRILVTMPMNPMVMNFYNLETGKKFKSINFSNDGLNRVGSLDGFEVYNSDTILITSYPPMISIFDFEGNKLNQVKIEAEDQYIQAIMSTNAIPIIRGNGKIWGAYPFITRFWETPMKDASNFNHIYEIDLKNLSVNWLGLNLPDGFWAKGKISPRFSWTNRGDSLITLFDEDPRVQVFSVRGNRILDIIDLKTPEEIDFIRYFDKSTGYDAVRKELDKGVFRSIQYDRYRKIYYVFYDMPANPELYSIPIYELHVSRPNFKLFLFDQDFKYIGESVFKDYAADPYRAFVGKKGLYVPVNREYNENYNEDFLMYDIIRFEGLNYED